MNNKKQYSFLQEMNLPYVPFVGGGADAPQNLGSAALAYTAGAGSKYLKDRRLVDRIVTKYPNPMELKARLLRMNNSNAQILAAKINETTTIEDYRKLLHKYVCQSGFGRYLLHAIFGFNSGVLNSVDALANELSTVDDAIGRNV